MKTKKVIKEKEELLKKAEKELMDMKTHRVTSYFDERLAKQKEVAALKDEIKQLKTS